MITRSQIQAVRAAQRSLSLLDMPAAALSAIHDALLMKDSDGFFVSHEYAAAFRLTCTTLRGVVILPSTLKLSLPAHRLWAMPSLAAMLSKPAAASTKLCLRLEDAPDEDDLDPPMSKLNNLHDWLHDLDRHLGDQLHSLEIPCPWCIAFLLTAIRRHLPGLRRLVLRMRELSYAAPDEFKSDSESCSEEEGGESQLSTIVLSKPSGSIPFLFWSDEQPLDLFQFPALKDFVLQGPIAKMVVFVNHFNSNGGHPFLVPAHVKVTIDPRLCGHEPTPWARPLTVYRRFERMPGSAIPLDEEYKEEDNTARKERMQAIFDAVEERAIGKNGGRSKDERIKKKYGWSIADSVGSHLGVCLSRYMRDGRSDDLLDVNVHSYVDAFAEEVLTKYRETLKNIMKNNRM
ncbi:hypothetical protein DUNSADRAFT_7080 [Dunaliella salina]|uniref:Uncharacterized protein n=1 Tax=Dunaliella salina TaxID=3046 RepID=A0ABQ7H6I0_DUNSA|nr:hypothetical protein DUNSADRAFT_7080 [Dunaliella salina]|eukprot:KAF5842470.1 hypothetical protein DUNSADRAFT_7080 [Dunaliella salina]